MVQLTPGTGAQDDGPLAQTLLAGQVLFRQGDPGDLVWVVDDGQIELVRERADGGEDPVAVVGPGRYFGELAPVFGLRRSATARAVTAATVTGYGPVAFRHHVGDQVAAGS